VAQVVDQSDDLNTNKDPSVQQTVATLVAIEAGNYDPLPSRYEPEARRIRSVGLILKNQAKKDVLKDPRDYLLPRDLLSRDESRHQQQESTLADRTVGLPATPTTTEKEEKNGSEPILPTIDGHVLSVRIVLGSEEVTGVLVDRLHHQQELTLLTDQTSVLTPPSATRGKIQVVVGLVVVRVAMERKVASNLRYLMSHQTNSNACRGTEYASFRPTSWTPLWFVTLGLSLSCRKS
jgi:hypothetical protein